MGQKIRIATYNHMFGGNGIPLWDWVYLHYHVFTKKLGKAKHLLKIERTIKTLKKINPDIVGISEVLGEEQREILIRELKKIGYQSFNTGKGWNYEKEKGLETLIATKKESQLINSPKFPLPEKGGLGSGIVEIKMDNIYIIQAHLPLYRSRRKYFKKQIEWIENRLEELEEKKESYIVMGDFNTSYKELKKQFPIFRQLHHVSPEIGTCPLTKVVRRLFLKDIDHIFTTQKDFILEKKWDFRSRLRSCTGMGGYYSGFIKKNQL